MTKQEQNQGFNTVEILLVVFFVIALAGIGWFVYSKRSATTSTPATTQTSTSTTTPDATAVPADPTADWKTYSNDQISFKYPADWKVKVEGDNASISVGSPDLTYGGPTISKGANFNVLLSPATVSSIDKYDVRDYYPKNQTTTTVDGVAAIRFDYDVEGTLSKTIYIKNNQEVHIFLSYTFQNRDPAVTEIYDNFLKNFKLK